MRRVEDEAERGDRGPSTWGEASSPHLLACSCGSTIKGHLVPRVTSTPFSVEKSSAGRPCMFQSLTSSLLARKSEKLNSAEQGMLRPFTLFSHCEEEGEGHG